MNIDHPPRSPCPVLSWSVQEGDANYRDATVADAQNGHGGMATVTLVPRLSNVLALLVCPAQVWPFGISPAVLSTADTRLTLSACYGGDKTTDVAPPR